MYKIKLISYRKIKMNLKKIKEDIENKEPHLILNYLKDNKLDSQCWFNEVINQETLFFNLFFKDYELSLSLLKAFYPYASKINHSSVIHAKDKPCYLDNYLTPIVQNMTLMDYLSTLLTPNHSYDEKKLSVLGQFTKGFRQIMDYKVEVSRESLTYYNIFLNSFTQNPNDFKTHELIRLQNDKCYIYDNTISLAIHYFKMNEIQEFKNCNDWNRLVAFIPLLSSFCCLHKMAYSKLSTSPNPEKSFIFLQNKLEENLLKVEVFTQKDWAIFHELKNSTYNESSSQYSIVLPSDSVLCQPYQYVSDVLVYETVKKFSANKIEALYLDKNLNQEKFIQKAKIKL